jgi:hypothetical protein
VASQPNQTGRKCGGARVLRFTHDVRATTEIAGEPSSSPRRGSRAFLGLRVVAVGVLSNSTIPFLITSTPLNLLHHLLAERRVRKERVNSASHREHETDFFFLAVRRSFSLMQAKYGELAVRPILVGEGTPLF